MKEFVITIEYERGIDRIMDVFMEYPETIAKAATCLATRNNMWRLDRITGPAEALSALDDVFLDPTYCNECLDSKRCSKEHRYETLSRDTMERNIYTYESNGESCPSVPHLAVEHLGDGLLFEAIRRENQYEWRILMLDTSDVSSLYDTLQATLPEKLQLNLNRLSDPMRWGDDQTVATDFPPKQREVIEAAVNHGYYETPRGITAAELSEKLDTPRSTLQYRLQRAEAQLANRFVSGSF